MSLENYLAKSNGPYEEILWEFRNDEIVQLYNQLRTEGFGEHFVYVKEHLTDILKYISLSPSQREQKKWTKRPDLLMFRFSALQISYSTVKFLSDASPMAQIVDSDSYRKFHSLFANLIGNIAVVNPLLSFPFADYPNPFRKGSPESLSDL
ncbi:hypothetical protein DWX97_14310 [Bacteroides cellulosilyticus]|uniref:Uncharacterized protein n=1 Tax=Bacteroides cellulosilyticus TaxID=246787 RepID=A0A412IFP5_9BACE|nr:hypothetical protein [Bacteroides cellulosilyticus]RGS35837.1 hypothetical protein DWX97_14310 [Bacteroides cellulosilyticus]DAN01297.1 MAG TPA: hypothetical protein [Caudoviricetes sp.]